MLVIKQQIFLIRQDKEHGLTTQINFSVTAQLQRFLTTPIDFVSQRARLSLFFKKKNTPRFFVLSFSSHYRPSVIITTDCIIYDAISNF